jgi:hypothetical protein
MKVKHLIKLDRERMTSTFSSMIHPDRYEINEI